jgi:hypothetical protein
MPRITTAHAGNVCTMWRKTHMIWNSDSKNQRRQKCEAAADDKNRLRCASSVGHLRSSRTRTRSACLHFHCASGAILLCGKVGRQNVVNSVTTQHSLLSEMAICRQLTVKASFLL